MDDDAVRARRIKAFAAYHAIESLPMPAIAVVEGPAVGSGCEIATDCDFIIATDKASFRTPEALWGTVGATQRLPRIPRLLDAPRDASSRPEPMPRPVARTSPPTG
jgi:enoyl-CoA hydratase